MDFELDVAQQVIATSAADVLRGAQCLPAGGRPPAPPAPLRRAQCLPAGGRPPAPPAPSALQKGEAAWQALAKAGLLALTLPGWLDGDELGVLETAVLLTEVGRAAASVPVLATIMLGALPVIRWGSRDLQEQILAGVGNGETILSGAVRETSTPMPVAPATTAALAENGRAGTVTGTKVGVPYAAETRWLLVPATITSGGRAVVIVDPAAGGVDVIETPASGDVPEYTVRLDQAPVAGVLGAGRQQRAEAVDDLYQLAAAGAAATADGVLAGALDLTSRYIASREQFGKPLATFQAVAQQIADVYITSRTLHLAAQSACWRLAAGLDAAEDIDVAAYWLAQEGPTAMRTCHHLHGGIGLDVEYPMHRYSSMINDLARFVGGADYRLSLLSEIRMSDSRVSDNRTSDSRISDNPISGSRISGFHGSGDVH